MGWIAITRQLEVLREDEHGRPVQAGDEGKLLAILQEDYGRKVAVDLINGTISIDYESWFIAEDKKFYLENPKFTFLICEETTIVGELQHIEQVFHPYRDEEGRKVLQDGRWVMVRTDYMTPLTWRPIWFSRVTNGVPTKVIGAQTTTPKDFGARNVKKMVSIFVDGRIGVD